MFKAKIQPRTAPFEMHIGEVKATPFRFLKRISLAIESSMVSEQLKKKLLIDGAFFEKRVKKSRCRYCLGEYYEHSLVDACPREVEGWLDKYYFMGDDDFFKIIEELRRFIFRIRMHGINLRL